MIDIDLRDTPTPEALERCVWVACARTMLTWEQREDVVKEFRLLLAQDFVPTEPGGL